MKPLGKIISKQKAIEIASDWHDGQESALYSFASSKTYLEKKYNEYIHEINRSNPTTCKGKAQLENLKKFFEFKHFEHKK